MLAGDGPPHDFRFSSLGTRVLFTSEIGDDSYTLGLVREPYWLVRTELYSRPYASLR